MLARPTKCRYLLHFQLENESKSESFENVYYKSHWAFQAISKWIQGQM